MTPSSDMPEKVSAERLREIVDGCEGVTPEPWRVYEDKSGTVFVRDATNTKSIGLNYYPDDAAHIARLDPATVRSIGLELIEARALIDTLQRERDDRNEWAAMWHGVVETLATVHGLGILDYNEVIPAFGRYVDAIKAERHELRAEVTRLREALEPFAEHDTGAVEAVGIFSIPDEHPLLGTGLGNDWRPSITVGDFRRARSALSKDTP